MEGMSINMDFTPGELMFYGGIVGMIAVVIVSAVMIFILAGSRKRLRRKLNDDYYKND